MPFVVPNAAEAALPQQARPDSRDLDIMNAAEMGTGVLSGGSVTSQTTPNMTVQVAKAQVLIGGAAVTVPAGDSPACAAADATNPRIDLLTADTAGAKLIVQGSPAAVPVMPAIPTGRVVLARLDVPPGAVSVSGTQIVDKRVMLLGATIYAEDFGAVGDGRMTNDGAMTSGSATLTSASLAFTSGDVGKVAVVYGAGASGVALVTTVSAYVSATQVTLAATASTTVTGVETTVGTNDQAGLQNALNALVPGQTLKLAPNKHYLHSAVLVCSVARTTVDGMNSRLTGYVSSACALRITGNDVTLQNLVAYCAGMTVRPSAPDQSSIIVLYTSGFIAHRVTAIRSTFGLFGASNFWLYDVTMRDTWADGIHMTDGCNNGLVVRPVVVNPGDDGVAVVSYNDDANICRHITIRSPRVWNQTYGRGVSCVGGTDITYTDVQVYGSWGAAIYVGQEWTGTTAQYTKPVTRVKVLGGRVVRSNYDSTVDHGAILVFTQQANGVVRDVEISDVIIENTRPGASYNMSVVLASGASIVDSKFNNMNVVGIGPGVDFAGPTSGFTRTGWDSTQKLYPTRVLGADVTTTSTSIVAVTGLIWNITDVGTYLIELYGTDASSITTGGPRFGVNGAISGVGTTGIVVEQNTSLSAVTKAIGSWAATAGANPGTANTAFPVIMRALLVITAVPAAPTIPLLQVCWQMSAAGTGTLKAGTYATLKRVA